MQPRIIIKTRKRSWLIALLFFCAFLFSSQPAQPSLFPSAAAYINSHFDTLQLEVNRLIQAGSNARVDNDSLKSQYLRCRRSYKSVEFCIYVHPANEGLEADLNGPPHGTYTIEKGVYYFQDAIGFQKIEELIWSDSIPRVELVARLTRLAELVMNFRRSAFPEEESASFYNLAIQNELLQIYGRGFSGYDCASSGAQIAECRSAFTSCSRLYSAYASDLLKINGSLPLYHDSITAAFAQGVLRFEEQSDLDILSFSRDVLIPIPALLAKQYAQLNYKLKSPLYERRDIDFRKSFHDPAFFVDRISENFRETGEILFFDPLLSGNLSRSCADCHRPELDFTDGLPRALALTGQPMHRNTPSLLNAALQRAFQLDGRAGSITQQAHMVLLSKDEMGNSSQNELLNRIGTVPFYRLRFNQLGFEPVFDEKGEVLDSVRGFRVLGECLTQYILSLKNRNAIFDQYMRKTANLSLNQQRGFQLFMADAKCGSCHFLPLFNGTVPPWFIETEVEILGVPEQFPSEVFQLDSDSGLIRVSRIPSHLYAFKTSGLRNLNQTGPYMHNGSISKLEEVIQFYERGGGLGLNLNVDNQTLSSDSLSLSNTDKKDLLLFLEALNDSSNSRPLKLRQLPESESVEFQTKRGLISY